MAPILIVLLALSLVFNILLIRQCRMYYLSLHSARLDFLGQQSHPVEQEPNTDTGPVVVFFGDSRAAAWPSPDLAQNTVRFINRGVGGQTTSQVRCRFDQYVLESGVDMLVLQVGVNDLRAIPAFPGQQEQILRATIANIRWMVDRATENGMHVVLTTIFPLGKLWLPRKLLWSDTVSTAILEVNGHLKSMARASVTLLDTVAILAGNDGDVARAYREDYLHINTRGYAALNHELVRIIRDQAFRAESVAFDTNASGNQ